MLILAALAATFLLKGATARLAALGAARARGRRSALRVLVRLPRGAHD